MNRLKRFAIATFAVVAMLGLQQCNEEDVKPAPVVLVDPTAASNIPGETVTADLTIEAPNGADFLTIFIAGVEDDQMDLTTEDLSAPIPYEYTIPEDAVIGSKIVVSFQVTDKKGYPSAIANFVVTVGDPVITLSGTLTTQTLDAAKPYLLVGQVFVPSGVTLTIPAGTVIKGDKATKAVLVVKPGGIIMAEGTSSNPIVFTSNQAVGERDRGDWGGVIILGNAFVNQAAKPAIEGISPSQTYGSTTAEAATPTTNATENSGKFRYVRIEYAGVELTPNNETNSLTMGGVGNGTTIEYVQTSFGGDDSYEWFGGTVNAKYLVSLSTWDDDFDTDFGWGGNVQWGLAVRNPFFADQSGSNAFESDNQANGNAVTGICDGTTNTGCTRGVFSNISVLGPRDSQNTGSGSARAISANYANGMHIRRRSSLSIFNSFISGFRIGIRVDDQGTLDNLNSGSSKLAYNILAVPGTTVTGSSTTAADAVFATGLSSGDATAINTYWSTNNNTNFNNIGSTLANATLFTDIGIRDGLYWASQTSATYPSNPDFTLGTGVDNANHLKTGANFSDAKLPNTFFTTTAYRGAFGDTDWTNGWSEFQPLNKAY